MASNYEMVRISDSGQFGVDEFGDVDAMFYIREVDSGILIGIEKMEAMSADQLEEFVIGMEKCRANLMENGFQFFAAALHAKLIIARPILERKSQAKLMADSIATPDIRSARRGI